MSCEQYSKITKETAENIKFPELSKSVKYFKETEGGLGKMCKTVEDYAKDYAEEREKIGLEKGLEKGLEIGLEKGRSEERRNAICKMLQNGFSREMILLLDYSETELQAVEQKMFVQI